MRPQGKLVSIGGAEKRHSRFLNPAETIKEEHPLEVLSRVVSEAKGHKTRIEVITSASSIPEIVGNEYLYSFNNLGCDYVGILNLRNKKEVFKKENLKRLEQAAVIMMSGGKQIRLSRSDLGTPFDDLLTKRYYEDPGFLIAGTSAGAMVMSDAMIYEGTSKEALLTGKSKITKGFALLPHSIIDSHFVNRNRFGRLMVGVAEYRDFIGIGLAEDTGVIIREGQYLECIGSGQVHILDGKNLSIAEINPHDEASHPAHFRNMLSHVLTTGEKFDVLNRKFV